MPGTRRRCSMNKGTVDDESGHEIQPRHGQIDFNAARGFFLCLHGKHGHLGNRHRKATEEFLMMFMLSLVSGGMTMRNAMGSST